MKQLGAFYIPHFVEQRLRVGDPRPPWADLVANRPGQLIENQGRRLVPRRAYGPLGINTKAITYDVTTKPDGAVHSDGYRQKWIESLTVTPVCPLNTWHGRPGWNLQSVRLWPCGSP